MYGIKTLKTDDFFLNLNLHLNLNTEHNNIAPETERQRRCGGMFLFCAHHQITLRDVM